MSIFSARDYETMARLFKRALGRGHKIITTEHYEFVLEFANELEKTSANFHKELFLHNVFCDNSSHSFGNSCPFTKVPVPVPTSN